MAVFSVYNVLFKIICLDFLFKIICLEFSVYSFLFTSKE